MSRRGPRGRSGTSIEDEPHLAGVVAGDLSADPSEGAAGEVLQQERRRKKPSDVVAHSVWDEPGLSGQLAGEVPQSAATYRSWLEQRSQRIGPLRSWVVTLAAALCAGPWAIVGVLSGSLGQSAFQVMTIVVFGPLAEEVMKGAVPMMIIERRPYLFRSRWQIGICALASGLVFAAIENLIYLHVYIDQPSSQMAQWRWTVCTFLHAGCALIFGLGLMRIWQDVWQRKARPRLQLGVPYALTAAVVHGAYNGLMVLLALGEYRF